MGLLRGNTALRDKLGRGLERRRKEIDDLLQAYGVPLVQRE
ncbi:hypothetical protein [Methylomagnum sp.]